jgi:hypothetical protein
MPQAPGLMPQENRSVQVDSLGVGDGVWLGVGDRVPDGVEFAATVGLGEAVSGAPDSRLAGAPRPAGCQPGRQPRRARQARTDAVAASSTQTHRVNAPSTSTTQTHSSRRRSRT